MATTEKAPSLGFEAMLGMLESRKEQGHTPVLTLRRFSDDAEVRQLVHAAQTACGLVAAGIGDLDPLQTLAIRVLIASSEHGFGG